MSGLLGLSGGSKAQKPIIYSGLNVSSSRMDLPIALFWGQRRLGTNALWYNNFQKHKQSAKGKGGGKGGGQYTYSADTIIALCEGVIDSIVNVFQQGSTTTTTTLSALHQTLFTGTAGQAPWAYVVSAYPAQARAYPYTAYLGTPSMDLGSSATIPDNQYECVRSAGFSYTHTTANGWIDPTTHVQTTAIDVLLSDVIYDFLTSAQYGMGFSVPDIGDMTQYASYQRAMGLFFSPLLNSQTKATEIIDRWAQLSHSWIYFSGTAIQFVPLGDVAVTANGATYTPMVDVAYNLGPSDFLGDVPVTVHRIDPADCYNRTVLQINDRTLGYISNPIEYRVDQLVDRYGLRDSSSTDAADICDPVVGKIVAQLIGKRAAFIRNSYEFKLSYRFIRLLPGTTVTLTDVNAGLNLVRVRVRTVQEEDDGTISVTAEEFPAQVSAYFAGAALPVSAPTYPDGNMDPGNVNTPAVIEPDSSYTGGVPQLIVAASGGANWGGCRVWASFDGTDYQQIGMITERALQGVLTASLASHADPDSTNTLAVNCAESLGVPQSVTHADADALRTLSLVSAQPVVSAGVSTLNSAGELLAFGDVAATGAYTANLTYLRRGKYGTAPGAHSSGDQFSVINVLGATGTSLAFDLPAQYIGQPIYLKFTSLNLLNAAEQSLASVVEYKYIPTGKGFGGGTAGIPTTPSGLTATAGSGQVVLAWSANPATDNVIAYEVWRATGASQPFGSAAKIATTAGLSWIDTTGTIGQAYTYFIVADNAVGSSASSSGANGTSAALSGIGQPFGFAFQRDIGGITVSQAFAFFDAPLAWTIPASLTDSQGAIGGSSAVAPSSQTDFDIQSPPGTSIGTMRFAASSLTATFIKASSTAVALGQSTVIVAPANLNGMAGTLYGSIKGTR